LHHLFLNPPFAPSFFARRVTLLLSFSDFFLNVLSSFFLSLSGVSLCCILFLRGLTFFLSSRFLFFLR